MNRLALLTVLLCLASPAMAQQASAHFDAAGEKAACESPPGPDLSLCYGALLGALDTNAFYADVADKLGAEKRLTALCVPANITPEQMRGAFLAAARKHPQELKSSFATFFYAAMSEEFPCETAK